MNVYALRRIGTNNYLPARAPGRRGFSNDTPEPQGGALGPRLFVTKHAARCALTAWHMGVFTSQEHIDRETGMVDDVRTVYESVCGRDKGTMELVTFELREVCA